MSYPDSELALLDFLGDLGYAVTSTPLDLKDQLPVLLVQRIGGEDSWEEDVDYPIVLVSMFALRTSGHPRAGWELAESVRDRLATMNGGGQYVASQNAMFIGAVNTTGPVEVPYLDPEIGVYQMSYRFAVKGR